MSEFPIKGVIIQTYRAKIPGLTHAARMSALDSKLIEWKQYGVTGVGMHGFSMELPDQMPELIDMCERRHLSCLGMFGLDATDTAGKGHRMARVGNMPGCIAVGVDAEGAYDEEKQQAALEMGQAFRADAPNAIVVDQSWPVPTVHAHFPYEQFAGFLDAHGRYVQFVNFHAEQRYYNDWARQYGTARVEKCEAIFNASEAKLDSIIPPEARRPHLLSIQGSGWSDIKYKCVMVVLHHETFITWSEWFPEPTFMQALRVRQLLEQQVGLYVSGQYSGADAVLRFQKKYNLTAKHKIDEDNDYGPETESALMGTQSLGAKVYSFVRRAFGVAV